jgi:hypothetical protein
MTPEQRALHTAARKLRWQLSRLDYCNLLMKLGVRRVRIFDIGITELIDPS